MTMSLWSEINPPQELLASVATYLPKQELPQNLVCDHICYRVETIERYEELKALLNKYSRLANESPVNGRPICIFQLPSPVEFAGIKTDCIELPAPKENTFYQEGWEHAEFVTNENLNHWLNKFSDLPFDTRSLSKPINAEVSLKISEIYKIKFHEKHILDVIKAELNGK